MKTGLERTDRFVVLGECEAVAVRGGIDKQAQDALYMIGYAIGVVAKAFVAFFALIKNWFN